MNQILFHRICYIIYYMYITLINPRVIHKFSFMYKNTNKITIDDNISQI